MEGLASVSCLPNLQRRRRALSERWRSLQQTPDRLLYWRFRQATIQVLIKPESASREAYRARRELEEMLGELDLKRGEPTSQRLAATQRSMSNLRDEDLDTAHARITLQRLYRQLPRYGEEQIRLSHTLRRSQQDRVKQYRTRLQQLNSNLRAAEDAVNRGDLTALQHYIREALATASEEAYKGKGKGKSD